MRKEIKTLEDLKGLFEKPIFEWKLLKGEEVFVLCHTGQGSYDYIRSHGDIEHNIRDNFSEIPKPIEVTQENCQMWSKSSDAFDNVVIKNGCELNSPECFSYDTSLVNYQVCDIRPTKAETLATARPLVDEVAKWMKTFEEGEG